MINFNGMTNKKIENTLNIIMLIVFCFSFMKNISNSIGSTISFLQLFFINTLSVLIFLLVFIIVKNAKIYIILTSILLPLYIIFVYIYYSLDYFSWMVNFFIGNSKIDKLYILVLTIMINLFVCWLSVYFIFIKFNFYIILLSGISMYSVQVINDIVVHVFSFYLYVFLMLIYLFKYVYNYRKTIKNNNYIEFGYFLCFSIPICLVIVIIVGIVASDRDFIELEWYEEKFYLIKDEFFQDNLAPSEYFDLNSSGFGNEKKLGGDVKLKDNKVMEVYSTSKVYLRGVAKDTYLDNSWSKSSNDLTYFDNSKIPNDTKIQINGINKYSNDDLFSTLLTTIKYNKVSTKTVFHPMNLMILYSDVKNIMSDSNGTLISSKHLLENNFEYSVKSSYLDYTKNDVRDILRSVDYIDNFDDAVDSVYIQLPEKLPDRIQEKSYELTKNYDKTYDKVKAIENYLQKNYYYTLEPGNIPVGKDFVDYFLFESKKGYCTYFATAFIIMCRSVGIPARYVEGYIFPKEAENENLYYITNQQAHAWPEVYFSELGWVMFEPTTGFTSNLYGQYSNYGNFEEQFIENPKYEEYLKNLDGAVSAKNEIIKSNKKPSRYFFTIILIIILIVISLFLITNNLRKKMIYKEIEKLSPNDAVLRYYKYYLNIFTYFNLEVKNGETASQFSHRVDKYFNFEKESFYNITEIFLIARYSNNVLEENKKIKMKNFYYDLLKALKNKKNKVNYYFERIIIGKY